MLRSAATEEMDMSAVLEVPSLVILACVQCALIAYGTLSVVVPLL